MAVVVSDTSPLRALGQLRLVHVLKPLYGSVIVPPGVAAELERTPPGLVPIDLVAHPFVEVREPHDRQLVEMLLSRLGRGESEAIALALEVHADFILVDEALGRSVAKSRGLLPVGVVGVLAQAKLVGLIAEVRPLLDRLEAELDFRLSDEVKRRGLRLAGE